MELELKHLAPYLPYKLNGKSKEYGTVDKLLGIYGHSLTLCYRVNNHNTVDYDCSIEDFKPILRPLSDLTKEIEVNGVKIVPKKELEKLGSRPRDILYCYYPQMEKLFEWHFDVFNLIENNLAIDINTLKLK